MRFHFNEIVIICSRFDDHRCWYRSRLNHDWLNHNWLRDNFRLFVIFVFFGFFGVTMMSAAASVLSVLGVILVVIAFFFNVMLMITLFGMVLVVEVLVAGVDLDVTIGVESGVNDEVSFSI